VTPWELVSQLEQRGAFRIGLDRIRVFLAASCRLLVDLLPPTAEEWLQIAERYRMGESSEAELEEARVAAWKYLGKESCNFQSQEVLAVRALICLLFPDSYENGEQWGDIVHFFLDVSNQAADHQQEQNQMLRELFPEYLA
jgi:hypothetical protein